jgi:hypothetical protein
MQKKSMAAWTQKLMTADAIVLIFVNSLWAGLVAYVLWFARKVLDRASSERESLLADNRALMEGLARAEGRPLIFRPPETKPTTSWFAIKPQLVIHKDK